MKSNEVSIVTRAIVSIGFGLVANFFIVRFVLRRLNKPEDVMQQTRLAAILSILLTLQSAMRMRKLATLKDKMPVRG